MAAHKVRATARTTGGQEIVVYPETLAAQVICFVPDDSDEGQQATKEIGLDTLLNQYADEINALSGLQASLNNLIFQLAVAGVINGNGLDTVVTIDSANDIVLVSGMYANGKVYI